MTNSLVVCKLAHQPPGNPNVSFDYAFLQACDKAHANTCPATAFARTSRTVLVSCNNKPLKQAVPVYEPISEWPIAMHEP